MGPALREKCEPYLPGPSTLAKIARGFDTDDDDDIEEIG